MILFVIFCLTNPKTRYCPTIEIATMREKTIVLQPKDSFLLIRSYVLINDVSIIRAVTIMKMTIEIFLLLEIEGEK
jgi:hypothetical protein